MFDMRERPDRATVLRRRNEKKRRRRQKRYREILVAYCSFLSGHKNRRRWYHYYYIPIYSNYDRLMFKKAIAETKLQPISGYAKRHWYITEATANNV